MKSILLIIAFLASGFISSAQNEQESKLPPFKDLPKGEEVKEFYQFPYEDFYPTFPTPFQKMRI